jgi:hypothetical protein
VRLCYSTTTKSSTARHSSSTQRAPHTPLTSMYVTHHAHQHPPAGYRSTSSNISSEDDANSTPWPAPGIVHLFPDTPMSDIPASYTAGKNWTYVAGEGWFERGTYQFPQDKPKVTQPVCKPIRRQISYRRLARSILVFFVLYPTLVYLGWRLLKASVGLLLSEWRRWIV